MKKFIVTLFVLVGIVGAVNGGVGLPDTTFGTNGLTVTDFGGNDILRAVTAGASNTIIAAGYSIDANNYGHFAVSRYTADGLPDTTFDTDGKVTTNVGAGAFVYDVSVQNDGKIVVVGDSALDMTVVRYNADGSLDTSFDSDGIAHLNFATTDGYATSVLVQPDNKILVGGGVDDQFAVVRLNADGTPDSTFGAGGVAIIPFTTSSAVSDLILQADGKIIAGGGTYGAGNSFALVRMNADGTPDSAFNSTGIVTTDVVAGNFDTIADIELDNAGKIVAAGYTVSTTGQVSGMALARYNTDGSLDATFGNGGIRVTSFGVRGQTSGYAEAVVVDSAGKIIAVGSDAPAFFEGNIGIVRYNVNGTVDTTFNWNGIVVAGGVAAIEEVANDAYLDTNDKLIVGGTAMNPTDSSDFVVYRFETQGTTPAELVLNGGFEVPGDPPKIPAGWLISNLIGDKRICNTDITNFSYNGECAFRFKGNIGNISAISRLVDGTGLVAGDQVVGRFMVGAKNAVVNKADVMIKVKYADGVDKEVVKLPGGTYDYDAFTTDILTITEPVIKISMRLRYRGATGKVFFDNISLLYLSVAEN